VVAIAKYCRAHRLTAAASDALSAAAAGAVK
jgi:hypothetical protein